MSATINIYIQKKSQIKAWLNYSIFKFELEKTNLR